MPSVTFVGVGEAFDPDLANTSVLYQGSRNLLIDCGYSVPHAFWKLVQDPSLLDAIYVSHLHADHSFGLPPLLLWMREAGRKHPLTVFGGSGLESWLERLLDLGYPGSYAKDKCYPLEPVVLRPGSPLTFGGCTLENAQSQHVVRNLSLRISEGGRSFCYSGDGAPSEATESLFERATLLVHESYADSGSPKGHAAAGDLLALAESIQVETLCLVHVQRENKQAVRERAAAHIGRTRVIVPDPGDRLELA